MTAAELLHVGAIYHYWMSQAAIDNNHPMPMICQRAEIDGLNTTVHGTAFYIANGHGQVGDPADIEQNDWNPAPLVLVPAVGCCTARPVGSVV